MLSFLKFPACGIDLSDRAVKFVLLRNYGGKLRLAKFGERELPPGAVEGGVIKQREVLVDVLRQAREETGTPYVGVALPEERGYVVEMDIPAGRGIDLRETIELHLEERVPIEAAKAIFGYEETGGGSVAVSVVERDFSEEYHDILSEAGFIPTAFELESQAIARAVLPRNSETTAMIIDVGREQSNLSVVTGKVVRLAASVNLGGNVLARAIREDLGVSDEEAEKLKEEEGLLRQDAQRSPFFSIIRMAAVLRDEIFQRISYWNSDRSKNGNVAPVGLTLLCGGNANVPGLAEYLTGGLGVPVALANPWVNIASFDEYIPEMTRREALKFCTAIGLAQKSFNII